MGKRKTLSKAATVHDVARLASVSAITVSRALNAPERVSASTLERVRAAVTQTGYVPNLLAGGLRSAKSKLVAALVPSVAGPVFLETIQSLTDALDERGYQLLLGQSGYRNSREDALVDAIVGRRPAGIVLTGMAHSPGAASSPRAFPWWRPGTSRPPPSTWRWASRTSASARKSPNRCTPAEGGASAS